MQGFQPCTDSQKAIAFFEPVNSSVRLNKVTPMYETKFNTFDEALIKSDLSTVYEAMIAEFNGGRHWWNHLWESELIGETPVTEPGGSINITVHDVIDGKFSARTVSIIEKEKLDIEFFAGDFIGFATWLWSAEGNKTRVSQEWHTSPNSIKFSLASKIINIEKIHSKVINGGFEALEKFLSKHGS